MFNQSVQNAYAAWMMTHVPDDDEAPMVKIPPPSRKQFAGWVLEAWSKISDDDLRDVCRQAYFPDGMAFTELYAEIPRNRPKGNPEASSSSSSSTAAPAAVAQRGLVDSESDSNDESGSDTDGHSVLSMSTMSTGAVENEEEEPMIVFAKAARGVWGLSHCFNNKLYLPKESHRIACVIPCI